ncbi:oligomeric Golgi complex subunit 6 [Plectosphaerella plurivora]|uniref:Conserved oligomeric Golgi complex subunit 6 n=1 Tax=Plectosphaerella plurivora TaxID=936078 RepID=A0A9P8V773_9PEZI|nr:oligomeric Golgi complex subunit 6 [Plectosphaerella plurivora]
MDDVRALSASPQSALRGTNSLSAKITSTLSSSHADADFRDALALLDSRALPGNAKARRNLRLDMQRKVMVSNAGIIADFGHVAEHLESIRTTLGQVNSIYDDIRQQLVGVHTATIPVLNDSQTMLRQRANVENQQRLLTAFQSRFVLTDDEVATLISTAEPVDDDFFTVLAKAKKITTDCEILLGLEDQTLGLDVMDQTSKHVNMAFQKLYKWVQRNLKSLNLDNPQLNPSIRRAIRVLSERPSLFQNCLDFFADARQRNLSDSFQLALTGTSTGGREDPSVKPIEIAAHDPLRYVGDMLAWIHSATVGEHEALEVLFVSDGGEIAQGLHNGKATDIWQYIEGDNGAAADDFDALKALNDLVDRDISLAARTLRQRVEQVIQSNEDTILAYKIATLLGFYRFTFARLLGDDAILLEIMLNLEGEAFRQFRSLVRDHIANLQGDFQQTPSDLGPPDFLIDALKQLEAILQTYETSVSESSDREADFEPTLSEVFEPFISGAEGMARAMPSVDGSIFMANCLLAAMATLKAFDFITRRFRSLEEKLEEETTRLSACQHEFFRTESGLVSILDALKDIDTSSSDLVSLEGLPCLQPDALSHASQKLDEFLPSALMDAMDNVRSLQDPGIARLVTEAGAERFCRDFEQAENVLDKADELRALAGDQDESSHLRAVFPRTTGEIRVLLK